jgi:transaldolase/glucose-6-phosphate isomerase
MDRLKKLTKVGQSVWLDNINRHMIRSGELKRMIDQGEIRGVTSNPTIFNNAISKSTDYDSAIQSMSWAGWDAESIFWQLAKEDICSATDLFRPLFDKTKGKDGFVSLEVDPRWANDGLKMLKQAETLWKEVDRPNLMIKIPGTKAGLKSIQTALSRGININITLIFSIDVYKEVIEAYFTALEDRIARNLPVNHISSVASFFVSRVDTKVDALLKEMIDQKGKNVEEAKALLGKASIANTKMAYQVYKEAFTSDRFKRLKSKGAQIQRPLWASTSTKNPAYKDTLYIDELVAFNTVNTMPQQTLSAVKDHGLTTVTIEKDLAGAHDTFTQLEKLGISMKQVTDELEEEGIKSFSASFAELFHTIDQRKLEFVMQLGTLKAIMPDRVKKLSTTKVIEKLNRGEPALWTKDQKGQVEFKNRLAWLHSPTTTLASVMEIQKFADHCFKNGFTYALLLGMGGSSLAPEVFSELFAADKKLGDKGLTLKIVDSTDPGQIAEAEQFSQVEKTLYIISSKSGTTAEVEANINYFWNLAERKLGRKIGKHFIAITDPGTPLEKVAHQKKFAKIFPGDPGVGGRYSALTNFGMVPAALAGINIRKILENAAGMEYVSDPETPAERNPGLVLGAVLGEAALAGKDKLTFITDPELGSLGSWLEQLVAESSGKQGKGIVPIDIEPEIGVQSYSKDRLFVYFRKSGLQEAFTQELLLQKHSVLVFHLDDLNDIGSLFYEWEIAIAVACQILGVNPFDQPDVQLAKTLAYKMLDQYLLKNAFPEDSPVWSNKDFQVFGKSLPKRIAARSIGDVIEIFLKLVKKDDYIAINAFLPRDLNNLKDLQAFRKSILLKTGKATTLGFGPRYLHSTGQLHKGGPNKGLFILVTHDPDKDIAIPNQKYSFGILEKGQALGDFESLQSRGRRVIRIHTNQKLGNLLKKDSTK